MTVGEEDLKKVTGAEWATEVSLLRKEACSAEASISVTLWNLRKLERCEFALISPKMGELHWSWKSTSFLGSTIAARANRTAAVCRAGRMWPENPLNQKINFCGIMWDSRYLLLQKIEVHTHTETDRQGCLFSKQTKLCRLMIHKWQFPGWVIPAQKTWKPAEMDF